MFTKQATNSSCEELLGMTSVSTAQTRHSVTLTHQARAQHAMSVM
jgi:hypothetical protein